MVYHAKKCNVRLAYMPTEENNYYTARSRCKFTIYCCICVVLGHKIDLTGNYTVSLYAYGCMWYCRYPRRQSWQKLPVAAASEESWYAVTVMSTSYFLVFTVGLSCFQSTTCATSLVSSRISLKTFLVKVLPCLTLGGLKGEPIVMWGRGIRVLIHTKARPCLP